MYGRQIYANQTRLESMIRIPVNVNNSYLVVRVTNGSNTFTEKVGYTGKDPFAIQELDSPNYGRFSWQELLK